MMAERRIVVLREVNALKRESRNFLDEYLKNRAPDLLLLMTAAVGSKPDGALLTSSTPLQFDPLTGDRVPRWIAHTASSEFGVRMSESAIELLQAAVGNDLHQLAGEVGKLTSYVKGRTQEIGKGDVSALVGVPSGGKNPVCVCAVGDRNCSPALRFFSAG